MVIGIVSVGMTFVILTGGIDLSVGSVAGLTGIVLGLARAGVPDPGRDPGRGRRRRGDRARLGRPDRGISGCASFVVTLGMMAIGRSLAYILSGQTAISNIPVRLSNLVYTDVLGIPTNVLFLLAALSRSPGPI